MDGLEERKLYTEQSRNTHYPKEKTMRHLHATRTDLCNREDDTKTLNPTKLKTTQVTNIPEKILKQNWNWMATDKFKKKL